MKYISKAAYAVAALYIISCEKVEDSIDSEISKESQNTISEITLDSLSVNEKGSFNTNFEYKTTIQVGGEGAAEISAYDPLTKKLFVVNVENDEVSVFDISNIEAPIRLASLDVNGVGKPNSVAVKNGILAVAVEQFDKQTPGWIKLYDTGSQEFITAYSVGALPDMVAFSPDGKFLVSANEGEPNDEYTIDPYGTVSIIDVDDNSVETLYFENFTADLGQLTENGFRVFGPNASLSMDVEPEYVAISDDSQTAWVTLQENNGVAKINLISKSIEAIYPLGFKDYSLAGNEIDPSDKDNKTELANYPVFGMYMPDAIEYVKINGAEYIITANEGDARDYDGFSEEVRVEDVLLDSLAFPEWETLQDETVLGRLKITTTLGDSDEDGYYEELYSYGARSFSIWTAEGNLVYDSGNSIATQTLALTPDVFNGGDGRSDDKGAEPEAVEVLQIGNQYLLFVGLERNNQIMVYDITNPVTPLFLDILSNPGDIGPEGVLAIPAVDSPTGKDLLVISNEVSGGITFYEN